MQHIQEILNAKRLNKEKILTSPLSVSIKYDGTALQYSKSSFYKRPYKPSEVLEGKRISDFDLALNDYYNEPVGHLEDVGIEDKCSKYDVVNFEIINHDNQHTIDYSDKNFKHGLILLSAYKNGSEVSYSELKKLSKSLDVSLLEELIENETLESVGITYQMMYDNKDDMGALFEIFKKRLGNLADIGDVDNIEGFVLTVYDEDADKTRKYKVINPAFRERFFDNKEKDIETKSDISFNNLCETFNEALYNGAYDSRGRKTDLLECSQRTHNELKKRMCVLDILFGQKKVRDAIIEAYDADIKENGSKFLGNTLNISFLENCSFRGYKIMDRIRADKKISDIVFLFLLIYKRTHKNNVFNVDTDTNDEINSMVELYF